MRPGFQLDFIAAGFIVMGMFNIYMHFTYFLTIISLGNIFTLNIIHCIIVHCIFLQLYFFMSVLNSLHSFSLFTPQDIAIRIFKWFN